MKQYHLLEQLRMSSLIRLGMSLTINPFANSKITKKIRHDLKLARKDNAEGDNTVRNYINFSKRIESGHMYHLGGERCEKISCRRKHFPF